MSRRGGALGGLVAAGTLLVAGALVWSGRGPEERPPVADATPLRGDAPAETLLVVDPLPDGVQLEDVQRAEAGSTLDGGVGLRSTRFVRTDPPGLLRVSWLAGPDAPLDANGPTTLGWRSARSTGTVSSSDAGAEVLRAVADQATRDGRPLPPAGFVEVPVLDGGTRSLLLDLGLGRTVSVFPTPFDPERRAVLDRLEGWPALHPVELGSRAAGRRLSALEAWRYDGPAETVFVPLGGATAVVVDPAGHADDLAARLQVVDDATFRRWTASFARSGTPVVVRLEARGTTTDGRPWSVVSRLRDGAGAAQVRVGRSVTVLDVPGSSMVDGGLFVGLASTASTVEAGVDGAALRPRVILVGGRALVVADRLPATGRLVVATTLQRWDLDLAGPGRGRAAPDG